MPRLQTAFVVAALVLLPLASHAQETPGRLDVLTPDGEAGTYRAGVADEYHAAIPPEEGYGPYPLALPVSEDGPGESLPDQGCLDYENAAEVAHRIALVRQGGCSFVTKYFRAIESGARGLVLYGEDVADDSTLVMGYAWSQDVYFSYYGVTVAGHRGARLRAAVEAGQEVFVTMRTEPAVAADAGPAPDALALDVWPNPARAGATVALTLLHADDVTVAVHDVLGRRVAVLHEGPLAAGAHTLRFDADALAAGIYFVRASTATAAVARPLLLAR